MRVKIIEEKLFSVINAIKSIAKNFQHPYYNGIRSWFQNPDDAKTAIELRCVVVFIDIA